MKVYFFAVRLLPPPIPFGTIIGYVPKYPIYEYQKSKIPSKLLAILQ